LLAIGLSGGVKGVKFGRKPTLTPHRTLTDIVAAGDRSSFAATPRMAKMISAKSDVVSRNGSASDRNGRPHPMTRTTIPARISRNWFECWRDPKEFFCNAWGQIKPLVGHAPPQYLRDAYVAGLFAQIFSYRRRCEVKLSYEREEFPDARLSFSSDPIEFPAVPLNKEKRYLVDVEIVTADRYLRKTWKEHDEIVRKYKAGEFVPPDCPEKRRDDAREAIHREVKRKAERSYSSPPNLLVYLMISQTPTLSCSLISADEMAQATEPYKTNFKSIWVLSGIENVRLWPARVILGVPSGQDPFDCSKEC
jgi:hypothetical protein